MKLTQVQTAQQKLTMTVAMRTSLTLLQLGPEDAIEAIEEETRRNPFLRYVPQASKGGNASAVGSAGPESHEVSQTVSIGDDLLRQIGLISLSSSQERIARELPFCLDERGFVVDPIDEMCSYLDATKADILSVVETLQKTVEPVGVFAWSLRDCFRIQLEAANRWDPLILQLLDRLELVARQDLTGICELCGVDLEDAADMVADIRRLRPAPLASETNMTPRQAEPELKFRADQDGEIVVELNERALPKLLADDGLFDRFCTIEVDDAALHYYRDCYRGAAAFVVALQKRANTLLRIGQVVADAQRKFITTGRGLDRKPLTMQHIAETLNLNKSTVSRALRNCRIQTDRGVAPAGDFFVRPLNGLGTLRTRDQALQRLSILIRSEDKRRPHSDEVLAEMLRKADLPMSRRTVAKYRALLDIPGAFRRRERHQ